MPLQAITSTEPIPGYRISERIGAGGYGEVWKADAPGGLTKAIKFVYGYLDEDRATRELKALNRIKGVRHPFLLSLERIEIVDGQLLIVTELADASLKERFDFYIEQGQGGIPRKEILGYMRDAADVLDYMSEEYSLQHLDIKPENLLMVGGRVKVADFGLVKDIRDATASLMGGLTPLYAPPEVFDGRPSRWSDQYSLAIVYQEMLTGELPFPGTTAVQLAKQHLNAKPRLGALPESDREVIARALEKDPRRRFRNCREMVEGLFGVVARAPDREDPKTTGGKPRSRKSQTEVLSEIPAARDTAIGRTVLPRILSTPTISNLDPIESSSSAIVPVPTLYLGIGRTAACTLQHLRRRLHDRFGDLAGVPALRMLLLDTDTRELMEATRGATGEAIPNDQLLGLPLRRPQDYRNDSRDLLQWISRRWLYNIPRSLKTEGLRPLGRLAFVDHAPKVFEQISQAVASVADPESIQTSIDTTGLNFSAAPRVVVVSSISGGTGGGMVLDVAYAVRKTLEEMELSDDQVYGVLAHSTGRNPRTRELSIVNAYSCLSELNHFCAPDSTYPGDATCGIPARHDCPAFKNTYLVHLGDDLSEDQFDLATDQVAEYLYLDTATAAGKFFDTCREGEIRETSSRVPEVKLRTFGLHQISCTQEDIVSSATEILCRSVIGKWVLGQTERPARREKLMASSAPPSNAAMDLMLAQFDSMASQFADELNLNVDFIVKKFCEHAENELESDSETYFTEQLADARKSCGGSGGSAVGEFLTRADALLGSRGEDDDEVPEEGLLAQALTPLRKKLTAKMSSDLRHWILSHVDATDGRYYGTDRLTRWFANYVSELEEGVDKLRDKVELELQQTEKGLNGGDNRSKKKKKDQASTGSFNQQLLQYCRLRLYSVVLAGAARFTQAIAGQVALIKDDVMDLGRELKHLASQFDSRALIADDTIEGARRDAFDDLHDNVVEGLADRIPELVSQLDEKIEGEILVPQGGLRRIMGQGGNERNQLPDELRSVARALLVDEMKHMDVISLLFENRGDASNASNAGDALTECLEAASPALLDCGGAKRLMIMLPEGASDIRPVEVLSKQLNERPSVVSNCDGAFVMCYEVEQMSLTQVAVTLIDSRPDFVQFAQRLHTRTDISWSALPDLLDD